MESMKWEKLISAKRFGMEDYQDEHSHERTLFQRDYDRLIFSAPFRRLQNKTQVFPLPGSVFVHNRLTHSLEVSSVGRSLGTQVSQKLQEKYPSSLHPKLAEIGSIVSTACLAHDLGNPPFGHSGESAVSSYFQEGNGTKYAPLVTAEEWHDLIHFEGNANAFRLLTHQFRGRRKGGFAMTYSTLGSIVKYPYSSLLCNENGKFGFFLTEQESFRSIAEEMGIICLSDHPAQYARHPLVYLVEAADDICYQVMDIEDAHKLKLLTTEETIDLFRNFFTGTRLEGINRVLNMVDDENERIAYLRSCVIGKLVDECARVFVENEEAILAGTFEKTVIKQMSDEVANAYGACEDIAFAKIYHSKDVIDIELAGYKIITTILDNTLQAIFNPEKAYSKVILRRVPQQYETDAPNAYGKILCSLDYLSGMTDVYALDMFRKINGMSLPAL